MIWPKTSLRWPGSWRRSTVSTKAKPLLDAWKPLSTTATSSVRTTAGGRATGTGTSFSGSWRRRTQRSVRSRCSRVGSSPLPVPWKPVERTSVIIRSSRSRSKPLGWEAGAVRLALLSQHRCGEETGQLALAPHQRGRPSPRPEGAR
ncbi:hypothetical protein FHN55_10090 [Streptomyces sp. NP160]|uniref:hypothetical protein n=1 Tax=Streptomyces sp. NP160 TaxID=2586637 RepID=UPI0011195B2C|nr:hypothetical protein [Streptomyces sp. NP160]TNM67748.1 hypothetical protein FHN55_10090 [Streptomyces sp. NP160]